MLKSISTKQERVIVAAILAAYVILAIGFSMGPLFEGPDELQHYRYIHTFLEHGSLPDPTTEAWSQYHQAPLYYVAVSPLVLAMGNPSSESAEAYPNEQFGHEFGAAGSDNKNMLLHPNSQRFPFTGDRLALTVHLVRLISLLMGLAAVWLGYQSAALLWPDHVNRRILTLGFMAFIPQFLFLTSQINNDNSLILGATAALYLMLYQHKHGPSLRLSIIIGVVLGLTLLGKATAMFLVFPVGAAYLIDRRNWRYIVPTLLTVLAIAAWWYIRNMVLYGDPTGANFALIEWGGAIRGGDAVWNEGFARIPFAYNTFWARFGNTSVPISDALYRFYDAVAILAIAGSAIHLARSLRNRPDFASLKPGIVVAVFMLTWLGLLLYLSSVSWFGNQGRYLHYGLVGWGILFAYGVSGITEAVGRARIPIALGGSTLMASAAAICLWGFFLPAFRPHPIPARIEVPLAYRFGETVELIGVEAVDVHAHPGDLIEVTLYWRALRETDRVLTFNLYTAGHEINRISMPATGNLLSTDWQEGQTWAETYVIRIPAEMVAGTYPLMFRVVDFGAPAELEVTGEGEHERYNATIARLMIVTVE